MVSSDQKIGELVSTRLKMVTWNIWWRYGPWREREPIILAVLRDLGPDVVCLQEVWGEGGENQAARFADALDLEWVYDPVADSGGVQFGNAILSRWPVRAHESIALPSSPTEADDGGRRALVASIDGPRGQFDIFATHLCWRLHESRWRQEQVRALCDFVGRRDPTRLPPIVCGDFNAVPSSDEIRMMTGEAAVPVEGLFFHDAWAVAGDGSPGFTWDNANAFSAKALEANRRIDYIFVGDPHRNGGAGHITACLLVGDRTTGALHGSDHFGLFAEIRY